MRRMKRIFVLPVCLLLVTPALAQPAPAQPAPAQSVSPRQAQNLVNTLQDDQKRAALVAQLKTLAAVEPSTPKLDAAALGADLLQGASDELDAITDHLGDSLADLNQLPLVAVWVRQVANNPWARGRTGEVVGKLFALIVIAGVFGWGARRGTRQLLRRLALAAPAVAGIDASVEDDAGGLAEADAEAGASEAISVHGKLWHLSRLLPFVFLRLLLDLVPVVVFAASFYLLLDTPLGHPHVVALVALATLYVLVTARVVWCVIRMLVAPGSPTLRLVAISDAGAHTVVRWTTWISLVLVAGIAFISSAGLLGLPVAAQHALARLVALVLNLFLIAAVLRARRAVSRRLRAPMGARGGAWFALRDWVAAIWAPVAIIWIVALWFMWAGAAQDGLIRLLQIGGASLLILVFARLIHIFGLGSLERAARVSPDWVARVPGIERRAPRYAAFAGLVFRVALYTGSAILLAHFWGWDIGVWFDAGYWGPQLLAAIGTILMALLVGVAVWEGVNFGLQRRLEHLVAIDDAERVIRLRTVQPIVRTGLFAMLAVVLTLISLSQVGINVGPLLAGAGIAGLAIGFGAQKLVQDVITGLFLLLDNAVQVGDIITAAGLTGTVEQLSLRCLRLRGFDGALYFIPFSAVTSVSNANRGKAVASFRFEFPADVDVARVSDLLRKVGADMRAEEKFALLLLDDLKLWGIDTMTGDKIAITAAFPCIPAGRDLISYEFKRLLLKQLREAGIGLAATPPVLQVVAAPGPVARESGAHVA